MKQIISGAALTLLFISMLTCAFNTQLVKASETIYIRADGSVDPPEAPISTVDNVTYILTGNINDSIVVERNNIVIDGRDYAVQGLGSGTGIDLSRRTNVTIKNINIKAFDYGIYLASSDYNTVSGTNITNNYYEGIELKNSLNNSISGNNIIANYGDGIYLFSSLNNSISGNNISNNGWGISSCYSSDNRIFHNNLINNTVQAYSETSTDVWDDGYPSSGNYWSNYTGVDLYRGSYQNETGSDGIGDTPYVIDANNQDNYPLIKPYGGACDIGITNITKPKTVVGQGYNLNLSVKIINYGIGAEAFNVTVYANAIIVATLTNITLTSRNSATVTFTWNTSGFAKGNYTIWAYAWPVPGETDTADNTLTDGIVQIAMPGDVNADGIVDMRDIFQLILHYMQGIGDPGYVPNYDINCDGIIDLRDIFIAILHYGQTDP